MRTLHTFFALWLQRNARRVFGEQGVGWDYRRELRSSAAPPYKAVDNVLYRLDGGRPLQQYVVVELDGREHVDKGLVEDVFRMNWVHNARFAGGKVHVLRLNPDPYERADGMRACPRLRARLARVLTVLQGIRDLSTSETSYVRVHYLFYSHERLQVFQGRCVFAGPLLSLGV